ncbi:hypothetical protein GCM10009745_24530 [Kribbella yunnanensis]|uniref:Uncharacterized protein n=1 Tax=Kribbella yunnanensis TaxID=190194 RepID=A0ABN2H0N5_9ACTN
MTATFEEGDRPNVPAAVLVQFKRDLDARRAELFALLSQVPAEQWREGFRELVTELDEYTEGRAAELGIDLDEYERAQKRG